MSTIASSRAGRKRTEPATAKTGSAKIAKIAPSVTTAPQRPTTEKPVDPQAAAATDPREALRRALHWTRPDGSRCFSSSPASAKTDEVWQTLRQSVRSTGDAELRSLLRRAENRDGLPAAQTKKPAKPLPAYHSEVLQSTVLRTDWSHQATQLAVDWSTTNLRCELAIGSTVVLAGEMPVAVTIDGRPRKPAGAWEEVCFESEPDADYLELEIALEGDAKLQRQFLLTRRDGLLFMADAVLSPGRGRIECELTLPATPGFKFVPAAETCEGALIGGRRTWPVLPLALPEWRVECRGDELRSTAAGASLRQSAAQATALFAPVCLVLDSRRAGRELTWRRLTVGENLQIQPADRAVGYRIQLGRKHWLVYRSLTDRANRTVLGVNLQTNFLFARFKPDGETETLLEIE